MSGITKEQTSQVAESLAKAFGGVCKSAELLTPGLLPGSNPFIPQSGVFYLVEAGPGAPLVFKLPSSVSVTPPFFFEVLFLPLADGAHMKIEMSEMGELGTYGFIGDVLEVHPVPIVVMNYPFQHYRISYYGPVSALGIPLNLWFVERMDSWRGLFRSVARATNEELPTHTGPGTGSFADQELVGEPDVVLTVDGDTVSKDVKDAILVKDGDSNEFGIWYLVNENPWTLRRRQDWQNPYQIEPGASILVREGTANAGKIFSTDEWGSSFTEIGGGSDIFARARIDGATGTFIYKEGPLVSVSRSEAGYYQVNTLPAFDPSLFPANAFISGISAGYDVWSIWCIPYGGVQYLIHVFLWDPGTKTWIPTDPYYIDLIVYKQY